MERVRKRPEFCCFKGGHQGNMWSKGHWGHRPPDDVPQKQVTSSPGQVRNLRVSERMDYAPSSLLCLSRPTMSNRKSKLAI